ncbi:MAG: hypothetical protein CM15mP74_36880 [Halieaceae bacterium]|nr:MAG: hypothetical protein CM15mP74_36880 [Halieaceae bacterium]
MQLMPRRFMGTARPSHRFGFATRAVRPRHWSGSAPMLGGSCGEGSGPKPLVTGSRWMGMYTTDILELRDSLTDYNGDIDDRWLSELVSAPLANPPPQVTGDSPFVGREKPLYFDPDSGSPLFSAAALIAPGLAAFDMSLLYKNRRVVTPTWCAQPFIRY